MACTESILREEQCGFRQGSGFVDRVFSIKNIYEKYLEKGKSLCVAFIDLEKAYDRVHRDALSQVLGIYGIRGRLTDEL